MKNDEFKRNREREQVVEVMLSKIIPVEFYRSKMGEAVFTCNLVTKPLEEEKLSNAVDAFIAARNKAFEELRSFMSRQDTEAARKIESLDVW